MQSFFLSTSLNTNSSIQLLRRFIKFCTKPNLSPCLIWFVSNLFISSLGVVTPCDKITLSLSWTECRGGFLYSWTSPWKYLQEAFKYWPKVDPKTYFVIRDINVSNFTSYLFAQVQIRNSQKQQNQNILFNERNIIKHSFSLLFFAFLLFNCVGFTSFILVA